jgi:Fibronectin type III domain
MRAAVVRASVLVVCVALLGASSAVGAGDSARVLSARGLSSSSGSLELESDRLIDPTAGSYEPPALPTGWTALGLTIDWNNYSLPDYPGMNRTVDGYTMEDSPVIATAGPNETLFAYFINDSNDLVEFDFATGVVTLLHSWNADYISSDSDNELNAYETSNGSVVGLYNIGFAAPYGFVSEEQYNLQNNSFLSVETSIANPGSYGQTGFGLLNMDGWMYWFGHYQEQMDFYNVYSGLLVQGEPLRSYYVGWNSPVYVPSVGQVIESINIVPYVEVLAVGLSYAGGEPVMEERVFNSSAESFISGLDDNNMPYFFKVLPNGTTLLWGIESDTSNGGSTYHVLEVWLFLDLSEDRVDSVTELGEVGTTDSASMAFPDPSGYFLNGYNSVTGSASYQAPFLDPLNRSIIYATNSQWFNQYFASTSFAGGQNGTGFSWYNEWTFAGGGGYENSVVDGDHVTVYWLPAYANELRDSRSVASPVNLSVTKVSRNSISVSWEDPPPGSFTNISLAYGTNPSAPATLLSTDDASSIEIPDLDPGTTYYFVLVPWNGNEVGGPSNEVNATTLGEKPVTASPSVPESEVVLLGASLVAVGTAVVERRRVRALRLPGNGA